MLVRGMGLANGIQIGEVTAPVAFNQDIRAIHPLLASVVPRFLLLALRNSFMNGEGGRALSSAAHGTLKIDSDVLHQIQIPLPPIGEQKRIVTIIDDAFAAIAIAKTNVERNLRNGREVFDGVLSDIFSRRKSGWEEKTLGNICIVDWGNTNLTKSSYVNGGEYLAVSAAGCDGRIDHKEHEKGTPVLSAIGAQCGRMFFPEEDFTAIKNTITLTPREDFCTGRFLYYLFEHVDLPKRGTAQPFMAKGDIQSFRVTVPISISEQQEIVSHIDALKTETRRLESLYSRKLAALNELKHSLLHQAFSGQL